MSHRKATGVGVWGLSDDAGYYSVIHMRPDPNAATPVDDLVASLCIKLEQAMAARDDSPRFVTVFTSPGNEEQILEAIHKVVGGGVLIMGGSAADNSVAGEWSQVSIAGSKDDGFEPPCVSSDGVVVTLGWSVHTQHTNIFVCIYI